MSAAPEKSAPHDVGLAGEYVLGLLGPAGARAMEARAAREPALAAEIANWRERLAGLDASAPPMIPSPALWDRIEAIIRAEQQDRAAGEEGSSRALLARLWRSLALWRGLGFAGALASLVLAALLAIRVAGGPETPRLVAVLAAPDGRAAAVVNAYANGTVQLIPLDSIPVPDGRVLEVWTLQTREQGPVSLARMDKARTIRLDLTKLSPAEVGHLFEITLEPLGGSPTGKPTGPVLMKGLAATRL